MKVNFVLNLVFSTNNDGKVIIFKDRVLKQFPYNFEVRSSVLSEIEILWKFDLIAEVDIRSYQNTLYETLLAISAKAERYQVTGPKVDESEYFLMHKQKLRFSPPVAIVYQRHYGYLE
jgi:hypothetical protein